MPWGTNAVGRWLVLQAHVGRRWCTGHRRRRSLSLSLSLSLGCFVFRGSEEKRFSSGSEHDAHTARGNALLFRHEALRLAAALGQNETGQGLLHIDGHLSTLEHAHRSSLGQSLALSSRRRDGKRHRLGQETARSKLELLAEYALLIGAVDQEKLRLFRSLVHPAFVGVPEERLISFVLAADRLGDVVDDGRRLPEQAPVHDLIAKLFVAHVKALREKHRRAVVVMAALCCGRQYLLVPSKLLHVVQQQEVVLFSVHVVCRHEVDACPAGRRVHVLDAHSIGTVHLHELLVGRLSLATDDVDVVEQRDALCRGEVHRAPRRLAAHRSTHYADHARM